VTQFGLIGDAGELVSALFVWFSLRELARGDRPLSLHELARGDRPSSLHDTARDDCPLSLATTRYRLVVAVHFDCHTSRASPLAFVLCLAGRNT
jgi:hypothetical protein